MLKEIIDKFYLDKEKFRKGQTSFYISEAGKCPRQIFLKFKNAPKKDLEAAFLRLFDHGENMHKLIMKPLLSTRDIHVVASEVNIPPQEIVRGRADAVLSDGKELFVLDIKSMNSMIFRNLKEPKEENVLQLQLYLHFFKIPKGILLYVDKDRLGLKEFLVNYNPAVAEQLISGLTILKKQITDNAVPARIPGYPSYWQCQYCQYLEVCKLGEAEEMKWEELKEKIEGLNGKKE
ncbi:PD-(D/E)XK nuclease family protein [Patescibacteria group bacterium]|nr:PD-(D/E)XK nuclease family protein [Patescibacteria group bacterium]MBU4367913.1 PD-(D/E)XK nuclease family protein [Patescibacteria group bacterium]MBU4461910.1 PD-(D/E)XK nuclease family protein [Patescibacteria group bacterium]MCG2699853.1 PD-(D/E)XK nuclease family protein [Candidatus Parcubacteria bacterium]